MLVNRLKSLAANLAVSAISVAVTLALLETVLFGMILKPDDVVENVTIDGVVRYKPGTHATFRHPDGRETTLTINARGWNSTKPDYAIAKPAGRTRIAVVGDSYVHGAFIDVDKGFPHLLERDLKAQGRDVEVYRFGMDGAPLSQYLNMLRREVVQFQPDIVVVPLIHNDFDESYRFLKTRYTSAFMKLDRADDGLIVEVPATPFEPGMADKLRAFATFRYLYYETGLYLSAKGLVNRLFWGGDEEWKPEFIQSAVDMRRIADHESNRLFARYVMAEMKTLSERHGFKLAFVMDGVREAVYAGRPQSDYEVGKLNAIAADLTADLRLPFVDLQEAFGAAFAATGVRLEFPYDWHWNEPANAIVAREIRRLIEAQPGWLPSVGTAVPGTEALDRAAVPPRG